MGGASALLMTGATPAKAGEEHLHGSSFKVYGLIPPDQGSKNSASSNSVRSAKADGTSRTKSAAGKDNTANNEPKIEDPPMPSYDGPAGGNTMASNEGATSPGFN